MRRCVDLGANPNDPRIAPLHAAALYKRPDILTFLIDAGGDINALSPMNETLFPGSNSLANPFPNDPITPLGCAILANDIECVNILVKRGASPNNANARAPLAMAIGSSASPAILHALLDAGATVHSDDASATVGDGIDYAFMAGMYGNVGALDILAGAGVTTDPDRAIDTVLSKAEANPDIPVHETVAWFVKHGGDVCTVPNILQRVVAIGDRRLFNVIVNSLAARFD